MSCLKDNPHVLQSSEIRLPGGSVRQLLPGPHTPLYQTVRHKNLQGRGYKESAWKRAHKHGFERILVTRGLKEAVWRKFLKGKRDLMIVDRFMNYPEKSKRQQKALPILHKGLYKFYPHQRQVPVWKKP